LEAEGAFEGLQHQIAGPHDQGQVPRRGNVEEQLAAHQFEPPVVGRGGDVDPGVSVEGQGRPAPQSDMADFADAALQRAMAAGADHIGSGERCGERGRAAAQGHPPVQRTGARRGEGRLLRRWLCLGHLAQRHGALGMDPRGLGPDEGAEMTAVTFDPSIKLRLIVRRQPTLSLGRPDRGDVLYFTGCFAFGHSMV
jgi:hypothetical protein